MIPSLLLDLGFVCSSFSSCFRHKFTLSPWGFSCKMSNLTHKVASYYSFNICRICRNETYLIIDFVMSSLFCLINSMSKVLPISLPSQRTMLASLIFIYCFSVSLISFLISTILFLQKSSHFICFSFSTLKWRLRLLTWDSSLLK